MKYLKHCPKVLQSSQLTDNLCERLKTQFILVADWSLMVPIIQGTCPGKRLSERHQQSATTYQQNKVEKSQKFFDAVLHTAFFLEKSDDNKFGLPAGVAKKLVDEFFKKHQIRRSEGAAVLKQRIRAEKLEKLNNMTQEDFQARADSYNGAVREKYSWSQKYNDVTVKIHLPSYIKKSKQVRVQYDANHLLVEVQDEDPCKPMIKYIDDDFKQEVNHFSEQTTWWFEDSILYVSLFKFYFFTIFKLVL